MNDKSSISSQWVPSMMQCRLVRSSILAISVHHHCSTKYNIIWVVIKLVSVAYKKSIRTFLCRFVDRGNEKQLLILDNCSPLPPGIAWCIVVRWCLTSKTVWHVVSLHNVVCITACIILVWKGLQSLPQTTDHSPPSFMNTTILYTLTHTDG